MNKSVTNEPEAGAPASMIRFQDLFQVLREKWWLILPAGILAGALGYWYISQQPLQYTARAVLQIEQQGMKLINIEDVTTEDLRDGEVLNTIVANIRNSAVMRRVIRANNLLNDPDFLPASSNQWTEDKAIRALAKMVNCELRKDTRLIDVTVKHPNPAMAQRLANAVPQEFIHLELEQRFNATRSANTLLLEEAGRLKSQLDKSEKRLQDYKEQQQTVSLEERQNIVVEKLKEMNRNYTTVRAARLQLEADLVGIQKYSNRVDALLAQPNLLSDPTISEVRQKVIALEAAVSTLALRYKTKHPKMIQTQRELQDLRDSLEKLVLGWPTAVASAYSAAMEREKALENALRDAQQDALKLERSAIDYKVLMRDVESDRALYDSVLKRLKETDLTKGLEHHAISIVEPAAMPNAPSNLAKLVFPPGAAFAGFAGMIVLVLGTRLIGGSIRSVDEAEEKLGLPVLAAIPKAGRFLRRRTRPVMVQAPDSMCAEAFRSLRTSALLAGGQGDKKTCLFTSAVPHEGKTFCSLNFAMCLAQGGQRTLLIELDLRRPALCESLGLDSDTPGVHEYLLELKPLSMLVQNTRYQNLFILSAGASGDQPAELLNRESVDRLLGEAEQLFDRVVIDSAPINAVSDTLLLLPAVHLSFLVVRAGKTLKRAIMRALEVMARAHQPPFGLVLNLLPEHAGYGCYYHYSHDYSYQRKKRSRKAEPVPELAQTEPAQG